MTVWRALLTPAILSHTTNPKLELKKNIMRTVSILVAYLAQHTAYSVAIAIALIVSALAIWLYIWWRHDQKHRVLTAHPLVLNAEQEQKVRVRHLYRPSRIVYVIPADLAKDDESIGQWAETVGPRLGKGYQVVDTTLISDRPFRPARYNVTFGKLEALR